MQLTDSNGNIYGVSGLEITGVDGKPKTTGGTVTSVGLTMPSAFTVTNSPVTTSGTLTVTGAGVVSQYVRGDGSLANFPSSSGGGSSLTFYLNGSVAQGTFGGVAFKEMDRVPVLGAGTDFTIATNGYIQSFITDANVPNLLEIPAGNWNFETYFSASSNGGSPSFYIELYKWNGATLSLIASNSATPEGITNGTAIDLYLSAIAVPQTVLTVTDRLAIRIYVTHSGRTIKLHTENSHLCQVITTFSTGLTALNGLTAQVQNFATGTSGTDFGISSATSTHTFNLPTASAANRGALSSADWSAFNSKVPATRSLTINGTTQDLSADRTFTIATGLTVGTTPITSGTVGRVLFEGTGNVLQESANFFWNNTTNRLGVGTSTPTLARLQVKSTDAYATTPFAIAVSSPNEGAYIGGFFNDTKSTTIPVATYFGWNNGDFNMGTLQGKFFLGAGGDLSNGSTTRMTIHNATGNIGINTTTDAGYKLDVNGTGRIVTSLIIGDTGNPSGSLIVGRTISIGYVATVGANQSFRLGGSGATINTNSFLMSSGGYNNQLGAIGICRYVLGAAPTSIGANSVTNLYVIGTETLKLNDGTTVGINSFYNAGIVTVDLSIMEVSLSGNSNVYVGKFAFRFKRYLINNVGTFTDISAVTNLYNSADAALVGTTLQAVANGANALDLTVTLPVTANTAGYRMGANVTITKVNINS